MRAVISLDIGTSRFKMALVDLEGRLLQRYEFSYTAVSLHAVSDLERLEAVFDEALRTLDASTFSVAAIGISAHGPSLVALDRSHQVLDLLPWTLSLGQEIQRLSGEESFYLPLLDYWRQRDPKLFESARIVLPLSEYFVWKLTGQQHAVIARHEFQKYFWTKEQIQKRNFKETLFPPFTLMGSFLGYTHIHAHHVWGLPTGIPLVACGLDYQMGLLGSGALTPGMVYDRAGSSEGLNFITDHLYKSHQGFWSLPHPLPSLMNHGKVLSGIGNFFNWFRCLLGEESDSFYPLFYQRLSTRSFDTDLYYMRPEQGAFFDAENIHFYGRLNEHDHWELGCAVLESLGFELRLILDQWNQHDSIEDVRLSGGQSQSRDWNQLKANLLGRTLSSLDVYDAELIGNASLLWTALGAYKTLREAIGTLVRIRERFVPCEETKPLYSQRLMRYQKLKEQRQELELHSFR